MITGATSGIGLATAAKLGSMGMDLIITGRREERLKALKDELESKYSVEVLALCFDVRQQSEVENAINTLPEAWRAIDILVNNAGLAVGLNHIQEGLIEDWERMIDTNIKGLLYVTR